MGHPAEPIAQFSGEFLAPSRRDVLPAAALNLPVQSVKECIQNLAKSSLGANGSRLNARFNCS
jgi:hypothetical protein